MDPATQLRDLINGCQVSQAIHVAATLGLSDLLADGPRTTADLAVATGCHEPSLARLMRALAEVGLYVAEADGTYASSDLGSALRSDQDEQLAGWARHIGRPYHRQAWSALEHSVRTGQNAFESVHGMSVWEYRARHPKDQAAFDTAMTSNARAVASSVLETYDFGRFASLVDVGGGRGALLAAILNAYPALRGTLFDLPQVVSDAADEMRSGPLADRCEVVGGDFFTSIPAGHDAYLMKAVIHDWADAEAIAILQGCRQAITPAGTLLLVERIIGAGEPMHRKTAALSDLNMLVAPGGRERTRAEFEELLAGADFTLTRVVPNQSGTNVIEATPR